MNNLPLHAFAEIRAGVTLRGRDASRPNPDGSCRLIRIGDIDDDGQLHPGELVRFEPPENLKASAFLSRGDVLFPNRGQRTSAHVFRMTDGNVIAGGQFFVLRIKAADILPDYLAWFLRSETAQIHFNRRRKAALVPMIQRGDLEELRLPIPPLKTQNTIVEIDRLDTEARALESRLFSLRRHHLHGSLLQAATLAPTH